MTFNRGPLYTPDGDYEVVRGFWAIFDVFPRKLPRRSWPLVVVTVIAAVFAVILLAGSGGGDPKARDRDAALGGQGAAAQASQPDTADDQLRIVSKGCKCRHRLAVARGGATGWMARTWEDVTFEEWDRAQVGDPWPLVAPQIRSESRIVSPEIEAAVR